LERTTRGEKMNEFYGKPYDNIITLCFFLVAFFEAPLFMAYGLGHIMNNSLGTNFGAELIAVFFVLIVTLEMMLIILSAAHSLGRLSKKV